MNSKSALSAFGRGRRTPLVGRNAEMEVLRSVLVACEAGLKARVVGSKKPSSLPLDTLRSPQCVVLMGETGIGKTRLAEEVSREAEDRGWVAVWSRNYAQESNIPYRQWIEVLRGIIDAGLWQAEDAQAHPQVYARLAAMLPELYTRLPSTQGQGQRSGTLPARLSPELEQQSLWEAVLELFKTVCGRKPLLVVLDDIQWADTSSCELLAYLARRASGLPLMFLATCRETELPPRHLLRQLIAHMQREHSIQTLSIQPLTDTQISAMLAYLPEATVQYIQTQAAGNPFFAEELANSLGTTAPVTPPVEKQPHTRKKQSTLPDTITAALHHRVTKLSKDCQQLLSNAAILGGSFEFALICAMEARNTPATDEDTVLDLLDEALQAGVLSEEGRGVRVNYRFWHPLLVSHLYEGLSATKRALLHRRAAQILRQSYATRFAPARGQEAQNLSLPLPTNIARDQEAEGAATIVYHLVEGGDTPEQIVYYATLAGNYAYALSAYPEAERHYRVAVENAKAIQHEHLHMASLLEQLGECIRIQGNAEEARQVYEQALHERGSQKQGAIASKESGEEREAQVDALLWSEIGWTWYATNDYARARYYCERGEQVLREAGVSDGPAWARLYFLQSYIFWQEGHYDEARAAGYEALKLFEEHLRKKHPSSNGDSGSLTRLRRTLEGDPVDVARTHRLLGSLAYSTGQPSLALKHLHQALVLLEQHDHQREIAHVCCNMGHIHLQKAEHELAQNFLRRSLMLAERIGDIPLTAVVFSNLGELAARSGKLAEAESWYRRSLELAEQIDDHVYMSTWNVELASVLQDQGRLREAMACIYRALSIGRTINNAPCLGLALVALGNVRILQAREQSRSAGMSITNSTPNGRRFLTRARATLQRALALQGLEAETKVKGQLALAHIALVEGKPAKALQQAIQTLEEANRYESVRLLACTQRLLGNILAAQGQSSEAEQHFQQAIQLFSKNGMRLEYARTLQSHGLTLLQTNPQQALRNLHEAQQVYSECQATLDLQAIDRILSTLP